MEVSIFRGEYMSFIQIYIISLHGKYGKLGASSRGGQGNWGDVVPFIVALEDKDAGDDDLSD